MKKPIIPAPIRMCNDVYSPVVVPNNDPISTLVLKPNADCYIANHYDSSDLETVFRLEADIRYKFELEGGQLGEQLGPELVTNGDFDGDATGWTFDAGNWSYNAGVMDKDADGVGTLEQAITIEAGSLYKLTFTATRTASNIVVTIGNTDSGHIVNENRTNVSCYVLATNTDGIVFTPVNAARVTVDDVSVKKVIQPSTLFVILVAASGNQRLELAYLKDY